MVFSRTEILQREVLFIDTIENLPKEKLTHLKAIFFVRCTEQNVKLIQQQLKEPVFSNYFIYFANTCEKHVINTLAEVDCQNHNVVQQLQEVYADFQPINTDLFSLDVAYSSSTSIMVNPPAHWTTQDQNVQSRVVDGIYGVLMATRSHPLIRYDGSSPLCRSIATSLNQRLGVE